MRIKLGAYLRAFIIFWISLTLLTLSIEEYKTPGGSAVKVCEIAS